MLSASAFNAFLKTLEEPPSYAIFILATTERHKILPTILSRCQVFNFNRIQIKDMVEHLSEIAQKEAVSIDESVLHLIAEKADGGLRDALSMFDQLISFSGGTVTYEKAVDMLSILDIDTFFKLTDAAVNAQVTQTLLTVNDILNQGFDGSLIIGGYADHIRNLIVSKSPETNRLLDVADVFKVKYAEQSKNLGMGFLLNALNLLNDADERFKFSRNPRLLIELTLIKLCHINQFIAEIPTLEEVKKKLSNPTLEKIPNPTAAAPKAVADRVNPPSIKEDISQKVGTTRLGMLNRDSFNKRNETANPAAVVADSTIVNSDVINQDSPNNNVLSEETNDAVLSLDANQLRLKLSEAFGMRIGTLLKSVGTKIDSETLVFLVSGKLQEEALEEKRPELLKEIKRLTQSKISQFAFELTAQVDSTRKPYTDVEKLEFLVQKHPLLADVIEKLKLRLP